MRADELQLTDGGKRGQFNTGRRYTEAGQRITWATVQDGTGKRYVAFRDLDRMIDGLIPVQRGNLDLVDDDWVLRAYDDGHWQSLSLFGQSSALRRSLEWR